MNEPKPQPRDITSEPMTTGKGLTAAEAKAYQRGIAAGKREREDALTEIIRQLERALTQANQSLEWTISDRDNGIEIIKQRDAELAQAQARCAEARHAALEEAAMVCDQVYETYDGNTDQAASAADECREAIRALLEPR